MKFRMLILAVATLALVSMSFAQGGGSFRVLYTDQETVNTWFPLTYDCTNPESPVLADGTICKLFRTAGGTMANPAIDQPVPVGENGAAGQVTPTNEFTINSAYADRAQSSFYSDLFYWNGGVLTWPPIYVQIGCYDDLGAWNCMYYTMPFGPASSYNEYIIDGPGFGSNLYGQPMMTCIGACDVPGPDCTPTPSPFVITERPGNHGNYDPPEPDEFYCLDLCMGTDLLIQVGPLNIDEIPVAHVMPGCLHGQDGCNVECAAAEFFYDDALWTYDRASGMFSNMITVGAEGCVCFVLDDILPAEAGSFDAVPRDNSVELKWNTLSENGVNSFSVMRNSEEIALVNANNEISGSSYTYVDNTARNGVTYSYTLVTNNMDGTKQEWNVVEATPMSNLAVITEYALHQNFPNPFNPTTSIVFDVVEDNHVTLTVYNAMGQEVATLVNGMFGNGRHNVEFSSDNLTSGLYFYTVKIGNEFTATKKMLLVK